MGVDKQFGREDLQEFLESDTEGFLRVVAGVYNLQVNAGVQPDVAFSNLTSRLVREGINLPLVMDQHPALTEWLFEEPPEFEHEAIVDAELRIERRA